MCEADLSGLVPAESLAPYQGEIDARAERRAAAEAQRKHEAEHVHLQEKAQQMPPPTAVELASMPMPGEVNPVSSCNVLSFNDCTIALSFDDL
jgi:hypothetical protein